MNEIKFITEKELEGLTKEMNKKRHLAVIDGKEIPNWDSYIKIIEKIYMFPMKNDNYDGYNDWMRDLSWFDEEEFILCIVNYKSFLSNDEKSKKIVMELFRDYILPWWDGEVEKYCVGGEKRSFQVLLIE